MDGTEWEIRVGNSERAGTAIANGLISTANNNNIRHSAKGATYGPDPPRENDREPHDARWVPSQVCLKKAKTIKGMKMQF